ncbi:MAG: Tyrosine-specific transport protein [Chlamydiae bacterium]|nr:Tyrosine-specific transport protein [Chlamydiota bacterium]
MNVQDEKRGGIFGGMLLVAGSAIGAGMLGLPLVTGQAGFLPSLVIFLFCWLFMSLTALLLLEANLFAGKDTNIISMAHQSLGNIGKYISLAVYIFLIYSMLVAYVDASGILTQEFLSSAFRVKFSAIQGSLFFTVLFGVFVFLGTLFVDRLNRLFMLGLILTYILVLIFGTSAVHTEYLNHKIWGYSILAIPVVITSFGYHNIIPTLTSYLNEDRKKMITVVVLGGGIPLLIYMLWEWLILGAVPFSVFLNKPTFENVLTFVPDSKVTLFSQYFAFFAIVTSFLAQALALVDFLRDAFQFKKKAMNRFFLILLVLIPPFLLAASFPGIFVKALGYVGGFAAIILFVLIPAFMVWDLRYRQRNFEHKIVPGGRVTLSVIIFIGFCIMTIEFVQEFVNLSFLKHIL